jgi:hypothetical protein
LEVYKQAKKEEGMDGEQYSRRRVEKAFYEVIGRHGEGVNNEGEWN